MDHEDRERINRLVLEIIQRDFFSDFRDAFTYAHRVTRRIPLEPSNEIRNALNHLADALLRKDIDGAEKEITNGKAHILLAIIDCYIISAVELMELLSDFMVAGEDDPDSDGIKLISIDDEIRGDWENIKVARDKITGISPAPIPMDEDGNEEAELDNLSRIYADLLHLLKICNKFYKKMRDRYLFDDLIRARARGIWKRAGRPEGRDDDHWKQAESEMKGDIDMPSRPLDSVSNSQRKILTQ